MKRFVEFISEARTSQASQQAKKLGFVGDGHGFWVDKEGVKRAKTVKGKLEFLKQRKKSSDGEGELTNQSPTEIKPKKVAKYKSGPKRLGKTPETKGEPKKSSQQQKKSKSIKSQSVKYSLDDVVTIAFGKFNPPTKAHRNLLNVLKKAASGGNYYVFPSRSQDKKKNPLSADVKIEYMRSIFPDYEDRIIDSDEFKTIFDVLTFLNQEGYTSVNIVCGEERCSEIENLAKKYNGELYKFDSINVISSGPKDPDSEESSSIARKSAASGDFETFKKTMPDGIPPKIVKQLFADLGGSIDVKEVWETSPDLDPSGLRDNYIRGNLFKVGDIVESCNTGLVGEVIRTGANHLICVTEGNIMFKSWIKDLMKYK